MPDRSFLQTLVHTSVHCCVTARLPEGVPCFLHTLFGLIPGTGVLRVPMQKFIESHTVTPSLPMPPQTSLLPVSFIRGVTWLWLVFWWANVFRVSAVLFFRACWRTLDSVGHRLPSLTPLPPASYLSHLRSAVLRVSRSLTLIRYHRVPPSRSVRFPFREPSRFHFYFMVLDSLASVTHVFHHASLIHFLIFSALYTSRQYPRTCCCKNREWLVRSVYNFRSHISPLLPLPAGDVCWAVAALACILGFFLFYLVLFCFPERFLTSHPCLLVFCRYDFQLSFMCTVALFPPQYRFLWWIWLFMEVQAPSSFPPPHIVGCLALFGEIRSVTH